MRARTDATLLGLERADFHRLLGPLVPQLTAAAAHYKGYVATSTCVGRVSGRHGGYAPNTRACGCSLAP